MSAILSKAHEDLLPILTSMPRPSELDSPRTIDAWSKLFNLFHGVTMNIGQYHPDFMEVFDSVEDLPEKDAGSDRECEPEDREEGDIPSQLEKDVDRDMEDEDITKVTSEDEEDELETVEQKKVFHSRHRLPRTLIWCTGAQTTRSAPHRGEACGKDYRQNQQRPRNRD